MKHIFLDANVIIDFLAGREPFATDAAYLFDAAVAGTCKVYVCALSFNNIWYVLSQTLKETRTIGLLKELEKMTIIAPITQEIIRQALDGKFKDFEDAVQYFCALDLGIIDALATRNSRDFKNSELSIMSPAEAVAFLRV
jgi:predicted nucleic acid-binding protein